MSAYGDMDNIRTAMNRGAFDFVTKPIDFRDLRVTIDRTLSHIEEWKAALQSRDQLVAIQNELNVASTIQQSILPTEFPSTDQYSIYGSMESARNVGGDFFDVITLEDGHLGLAIADVSDKGVPAALFMMSSRTLLKGTAIGLPDPGEVLTTVNDLLVENNETAMFVTSGLCRLRSADRQTDLRERWTQPAVGHSHADGSSTLLPQTGGIMLGVMDGFAFEQSAYTLERGETLVLYTDGVTEAMNEDAEEFGVERLVEVFESDPSHATDPQAATEAIFSAVHEFAGDAPQSDDITCLTICRG